MLVGTVKAATSARRQASGLTVTATTETRGYVNVGVRGPANVAVRLSEDGVVFATVPTGAGEGAKAKALTWRCDRRVRRIVAEASLPDGGLLRGETTVRTPSCAGRFSVSLTPRTAGVVGRSVRVSVRDAWGLRGVAGRACLRVRGASACRDVSLPGRVNFGRGGSGWGSSSCRARGSG